MPTLQKFAAILAAATLAIAAPAIAQTRADDARFAAAQDRLDRELAAFRVEADRYRSLRQDRRGGGYRQNNRYDTDERDENGYDAARYYREGGDYQERTLSSDERVYRGMDGRYYCKRNDGTTGLIVGALGGGILGNVIDGGRSRTVGTLVGGAIGAIAGREIDRGSQQVRCR